MTTVVAIVVGYDNELTKQDRDIIKNVRKNRLYEFRLFYYIPKIPAECFLVKEMVAIEQQYRNQAKQTLNSLSKELNIPLLKKNDAIDYADLIQSGPAAIFYTIKHMKNIAVTLTSHPDRLKPDLWDRLVNGQGVQKPTPWLLSHLTSYSNTSIAKSIPMQFIEIVTSEKGIHHKGEEHRAKQSRQVASMLKAPSEKESKLMLETSKLFPPPNRALMITHFEEEVETRGNCLRTRAV